MMEGCGAAGERMVVVGEVVGSGMGVWAVMWAANGWMEVDEIE